jgi:hypothetical protein
MYQTNGSGVVYRGKALFAGRSLPNWNGRMWMRMEETVAGGVKLKGLLSRLGGCERDWVCGDQKRKDMAR